jgi:hypothetical protein
MTERDKASLLDIARFAETILQLTAGMDEAAFHADVRTQLAVLISSRIMGLISSPETLFRTRYQIAGNLMVHTEKKQNSSKLF